MMKLEMECDPVKVISDDSWSDSENINIEQWLPQSTKQIWNTSSIYISCDEFFDLMV